MIHIRTVSAKSYSDHHHELTLRFTNELSFDQIAFNLETRVLGVVPLTALG